MSTQAALAVLFFAAFAGRTIYLDVSLWLASFSYLGAIVWSRYSSKTVTMGALPVLIALGRGGRTGQQLRQPRAARGRAAAHPQPGGIARPGPRRLQEPRADVAGGGHRRAPRAGQQRGRG
jgi:Multiple resistance and pH regulation protein F (MrpF / PhaF)